METKDNKPQLIKELETLYRLISEAGAQNSQKYTYKRFVDDAREIHVVPLSEVFPEKDIKLIREVLNPQKKECYKNATRLANMFNCKYVEGRMLVGGVFGCDHAFNRVGDKYVDITAEIALEDDPTKIEYIAFKEWTAEEAVGIAISQGVYGELYIKSITDDWLDLRKLGKQA